MSTTKHLSIEELVGNLTEVLDQVREKYTTIVVEYASGEKLVIKPFPPTKKKFQRLQKPTKADQEVGKIQPPLPSARLGGREDQIDHTMEHPPQGVLNAGEVSSTGAVYEFDPNSITPG